MEHILLIEDNLPDAALIKTYLEDASFPLRLFKAKSLQDGLDMIRYNSIDIVLLDLGLDDSTGLPTLNLFFEEVPNIPVVVLTGNTNEVLGMNAIRAGAQDFLVKGDFTSKQLLRSIRHSMLRFKKQCELQKEHWRLKQEEKRRKLLLQESKLGSWELDILDSTMTWSDETHQILGSHPDSLSPKLSDYLRLVYVEDKDRVEAFFENASKTGKSQEIEHRAVINNRTVKHLYLRGQIQSLEASGKIMLIGSIQDITDLRRMESKEVGASAIFSIETLGFVANMAHSMRTPLVSLLHTIDELERNSTLFQRDLIKNAREHMTQLTDFVVRQLNMVVLASPEISTKKEIIKIKEWKSLIYDMFQAKATQLGMKWEIKWEGVWPDWVYIDLSLLNILIYNLLGALLQCQDKKNKLVVSIEWKSPEIPQQSLSFIFHAPVNLQVVSKRKELLDRLKKAQQEENFAPIEDDITLTIKILARITSQIDGVLSLDEQGRLELHVPVNTFEKQDQDGASLPDHPLRALIIEPQSIIQISLRRMLLSGFQQMELNYANNFTEGKEKITTSGGYDLILVNAQILGKNGASFGQMFNNGQSIPVIALSSDDISVEKKAALSKSGTLECIASPPQREELLNTVRKVLKN